MTQVWSGKLNATDTQDFIDKIKNTAVAAGWTLHDDLSGSSPYAYVLKSDGEDSDEMDTYLYVFQDTDLVYFRHYAYWNNTTHAGTYYIGGGYSRVPTDDDASFDCYISANGSSIAVEAFIGGKWNILIAGCLVPFNQDAEGTLQSGVSSGSSVVLTLGSGEADNFEVGKYYQIVDGPDSGAYREWCQVSAVNSGSNQITISSLSYSYVTGSVIGTYPYRWCLTQSLYINYVYTSRYDIQGNTDASSYSTMSNVVNMAYCDPNARAGGDDMFTFVPPMFYDGLALGGIANEHFLFLFADLNTGTSEHTVSIGDLDTGTSSGSNTSTTLNDTTKSWGTNDYQGKVVVITAGTGAGQFNTITSNTATALTVDNSWVTTPDATSEYTICEEGWMFFYNNNAAAGAMVVRAY